MRTVRSLLCWLLLIVAVLVASARLAHAQATNPTAIEFTSPDHTTTNLVGYRICFYPSATSTNFLHCNDVPKDLAQSQGNSVYRLLRATWASGLSNNVEYWPRVIARSASIGSAEVAPLNAPFSFRLDPAPRPVSNVTLVP